MTLKSFWRSMKYASGPQKVYRDQRIRLIEAINHCCNEIGAYIVIGNRAKPSSFQNFVTEDDLGDRIRCSMESVKFLGFRCFVFGNNFDQSVGSLNERLWSYKLEAGVSYEQAKKECAIYSRFMDDQLAEGITISQYRAQPIIYTWSPFQIYERLTESFVKLESYQQQSQPHSLERFILEQEYRRNFNPEDRMFQVFKKELGPRICNSELQELWAKNGSDFTNGKTEHTPYDLYDSGYSDDLILRSGAPDLDTKAGKLRETSWQEAKKTD
jgi:hypothetical protein